MSQPFKGSQVRISAGALDFQTTLRNATGVEKNKTQRTGSFIKPLISVIILGNLLLKVVTFFNYMKKIVKTFFSLKRIG